MRQVQASALQVACKDVEKPAAVKRRPIGRNHPRAICSVLLDQCRLQLLATSMQNFADALPIRRFIVWSYRLQEHFTHWVLNAVEGCMLMNNGECMKSLQVFRLARLHSILSHSIREVIQGRIRLQELVP